MAATEPAVTVAAAVAVAHAHGVPSASTSSTASRAGSARRQRQLRLGTVDHRRPVPSRPGGADGVNVHTSTTRSTRRSRSPAPRAVGGPGQAALLRTAPVRRAAPPAPACCGERPAVPGLQTWRRARPTHGAASARQSDARAAHRTRPGAGAVPPPPCSGCGSRLAPAARSRSAGDIGRRRRPSAVRRRTSRSGRAGPLRRRCRRPARAGHADPP